MSPSYYDSFMADNFENLLSPWDLYPFNHGGEDKVDALQDLKAMRRFLVRLLKVC